jgi:hypothetical protein
MQGGRAGAKAPKPDLPPKVYLDIKIVNTN